MSLIIRQSAGFSFFNYIGVTIGIFASLFLYPRDYELYGVFRYIQSTAEIFVPVFGLGLSSALIKFYPSFKDSESKLSQLYSVSVLMMIGFSLFIGFFIMLFLSLQLPLEGIGIFRKYAPYILILALSLTLIDANKKFISNYKTIIAPAFIEFVFLRSILPILFLLVLFYDLEKKLTFLIFVGWYVLACLWLVFYLIKKSNLSIRLNFQGLRAIFNKEFYTYCFFIFTTAFGAKLAFNIDLQMISYLESFNENGIYGNAFSIVRVIGIPLAAVTAISAPMISSYLKEEKYDLLNRLYQKSSLHLMIVGFLLLGCLFFGIKHLFGLIPTGSKLESILPILPFLGLAIVLNMSAGIASQIIIFSKYYKYNILIYTLLAMINLILNFLALRVWNLGILGVSYATLVSFLLFTIIRMTFIYRWFKLHFITRKYALTLFIFLITGYSVFLIPDFSNAWINLFLKPLLFLVSTGVLLFVFNISEEVNQYLFQYFSLKKKK